MDSTSAAAFGSLVGWCVALIIGFILGRVTKKFPELQSPFFACPQCGEAVRTGATVCPHCHRAVFAKKAAAS